jgi:hypothetical protein
MSKNMSKIKEIAKEIAVELKNGTREILTELKKLDINVFKRNWEHIAFPALLIVFIASQVHMHVYIQAWAYAVAVIAVIASFVIKKKIFNKKSAQAEKVGG